MIPMLCEVQAATCQHFGLSMAELTGPCRNRQITRPRQIAMYLCRKMTRWSYLEIGRRFGGRDHSTVIHGCDQIEGLLREYPEVMADVWAVRRLAMRLAMKRGDCAVAA